MPIVRFSTDARDSEVAVIRRLVAARLIKFGVPLTDDELDNLRLMASEVATNAILHGCDQDRTDHRLVVEADVLIGGKVRVSVTDPGRGTVSQRKAGLGDVNGRGLLLVGNLAAAWGVKRDETTGARTVWFDLAASELTPHWQSELEAALIADTREVAGSHGGVAQLVGLNAGFGGQPAPPTSQGLNADACTLALHLAVAA